AMDMPMDAQPDTVEDMDVPPDMTTFTATNIYDIQRSTIGTGTMVEVRGVVVTGLAVNGFWAQDPTSGPFSGIWCFFGPTWQDANPNVLIGSVVTVNGRVDEYFGLTEINGNMGLGSVVVTGTATVPAPTQVPIDELANAAEAEKWEGVLVSTGQVTVMTPFNTASSTF